MYLVDDFGFAGCDWAFDGVSFVVALLIVLVLFFFLFAFICVVFVVCLVVFVALCDLV